MRSTGLDGGLGEDAFLAEGDAGFEGLLVGDHGLALFHELGDETALFLGTPDAADVVPGDVAAEDFEDLGEVGVELVELLDESLELLLRLGDPLGNLAGGVRHLVLDLVDVDLLGDLVGLVAGFRAGFGFCFCCHCLFLFYGSPGDWSSGPRGNRAEGMLNQFKVRYMSRILFPSSVRTHRRSRLGWPSDPRLGELP